MPEAVIVATARSPIGRAFKGSLVGVRPDDLAATIVQAALDKVPGLDPADAGRPDARLRRAGGQAGREHGPPGRGRAGLRLAAGHDGEPVLRLVGADLADGLPRDQGRRGARVRVGRRRVRVALPGVQRGRRRARGVPQPGLRRGPGAHRGDRRLERDLARPAARTACCPTSTSRWARPPRTSPPRAASAARSRTSSACARRTSPRRPSRTASSTARSSRSRRPTAPWSAATTARGRA